jgi:hypothetical protein
MVCPQCKAMSSELEGMRDLAWRRDAELSRVRIALGAAEARVAELELALYPRWEGIG